MTLHLYSEESSSLDNPQSAQRREPGTRVELDFRGGGDVHVGSAVLTTVPLWWGTLIVGEGGGNKGPMENLCTFHSVILCS